MASKIPVFQDFVINGQILSSRDTKYKLRECTLLGTSGTKTGTNVISQANARKILRDNTLTITTDNTFESDYNYGESYGMIYDNDLLWQCDTFTSEGAKITPRSGVDSLNNDVTKFSVVEIVNHNYDNSQTSWDYWKTRPHLIYVVPTFGVTGTNTYTTKINLSETASKTLNLVQPTRFIKYGAIDGELTNCITFSSAHMGGGQTSTFTDSLLLEGSADLSTYISSFQDESTVKSLCQALLTNLSDNSDNNFYVRAFTNSLGCIGLHFSNIKKGIQLANLWKHYNGSNVPSALKSISAKLTWYSGVVFWETLTIGGTSTENESTFDENGFNGNGDSSTNKGGGDYDDTQNHIDFPTLPSNNVLNSTITSGEIGLHIYKLNSNLTSFLSNLQSDWTNYYKNIVSINLTKFPISSTSSQPCVVGGVTHGSNSYDMLTNQYASINFGTFDFTEYYGSFLDYANTNISIYLPYYSVVQLPTSKVMNGQISVKAYVDYVSGSGRYFIKSQQVLKDFECIIGQYDFNIYNQVPFVASNNSVIGGQILGMCTSAVSGSVSGVLNSAIQMGTQNLDTMYGSIGTTSNVFTNTQPYIIIQRCNTVLPNNYNKNHGYLANITSSITDLSGYTKINVTKVNGVPEWAENEIIKMLSNGVII